ncbi:MAG: hypothetical protein COA88_16020 [Kordia sp.]|nr:MAG: hypothetical protein COA88_16020 [Kordia sp.]
MKKILLFLAFLCISLLASAQATCNQTFTVTGADNDPTVLTINATDLTCQGAGAITSLQLINAVDSFTNGNCGNWYSFNLSVDGGAAINGCAAQFNGVDISGFTTLTITSQDDDNWAAGDNVDITIDVEVTFTPTTPPNCDSTLTSPANGDIAAPTDGVLVWSAALGGATGYNLTVGTTSGGNDVLATTALGNVTTYNLGALAPTTSYFVTIEAFNGNGTAVGCIEQTFTTYTPVPGDTCDIALPIACGGSETGTTVGATSNGAQAGNCGTGTGAPGVWYNFTGNGDIVTASLCNSGFDTKIQVYEGTCAALTCVGGNDDACGLQSETGFVSTVGTEYYIYVFGFGTDTGAYQLDITCVTPPPPPANDDCANAIDLTVNTNLDCTDVTAGTIAGATTSAEANATCGGTPNNDVWYTFTATSDLHVVSLENLVGSTTDMYMSIFEGTCAAFTEVMCSDPESATVAGLTIGTQYTVRVYTWNSDPIADTTFDICIGTPPPPITTDIVTYTPEQLITDVLVDADCATVNNIQYETHSLGDDIGFSYFTDGGSNFPFADGIILSSGKAADAAGPFSGGGPSHSGNGLPDTDLENVTGVTNTHDRVYIEFDFVPLAPQISFNYIMASSEYNGSFECTYADSFAFILTNVTQGTPAVNLAILPAPTNGNNTVVVTNIRPEVNAGCLAQNEHYFAGYTPASGEIAYGGRTVPLIAFANVTAGNVYHIKLVMADQGDSAFDTAIFLEGGSFSLGSVDLGNDVFLGDPGALCEGDIKILNAGVLPVGTDINWFKDGVEIPGETMVNPTTGDTEQILTIDVTGDYSMNIYFVSAPDCAREATVHIEFYPNPTPDLGESVIVCANKPGNEGINQDQLILNANVTNISDPNMGPLNYIWKYNGVEVQNGPDSTFVINATTVIYSTNPANGSVQYENPIDGSTEYADVVNEVDGVPNLGVYHLGKFTVIVTDTITNCSGPESSMDISYYENANCITIPTGISPNNDGVNDCLVLDHLSPNNEVARLQVFNRYGTRVYDRANHIKEWCGTNQEGDALVTGTYYYVLDFNNGTKSYKGWIYINVEN